MTEGRQVTVARDVADREAGIDLVGGRPADGGALSLLHPTDMLILFAWSQLSFVAPLQQIPLPPTQRALTQDLITYQCTQARCAGERC